MRSSPPIVLLVVALLLAAAAIVFERAAPGTWNKRLALPDLAKEVNRHTPLQSEGTFLPPRIRENTTLTAQNNPIILPGHTEIPAGLTLTLEPGTIIFAHEFSELDVAGNLTVNGTPESPVTFTSNERHPQNQVWNGIVLQTGARADIRSARLKAASPAITCLPGSEATLTDSEIAQALVGIFTESPACKFSNNRIEAIQDKIIFKSSASTADP